MTLDSAISHVITTPESRGNIDKTQINWTPPKLRTFVHERGLAREKIQPAE